MQIWVETTGQSTLHEQSGLRELWVGVVAVVAVTG